MPDPTPAPEGAPAESATTLAAPVIGVVSQWLSQQGFDHQRLEPDHCGIAVPDVYRSFHENIHDEFRNHGNRHGQADNA